MTLSCSEDGSNEPCDGAVLAGGPESLDEVLARHKKEKKDLQGKIMALKKAVPKGNGKQKKQVTEEVARLEAEIKERHAQELAAAEANNASSPDPDTAADTPETDTPSPDAEVAPKLSKAQKRREKKLEESKRRDALNKEALVDALTAPRTREKQAINRILANRNMQIYDIVPDGDCLYNALAHQLSGSSSGEKLRTLASEYIEGNKLDFLPFLTTADGDVVEDGEAFEDYCLKGNLASEAMDMLNEFVEYLRIHVWRYIYDYLMGLLTGQSSLERVLSRNHRFLASKTSSVEFLLTCSSDSRIRAFDWELGDETLEAEGLMNDEYPPLTMKPTTGELDEYNADLKRQLADAMKQIKGYKKLCEDVEERRSIKYCSDSEVHEKKLMRLWDLLMPDDELDKRISKKWQMIGFQGDDPATDFRGMGLLGLEQLVFLAQYDEDRAKNMLSLSLHPVIGFPFAIAGLLKNHFYNNIRGPLTMDNFHQIYCRIFTLFCDYWNIAHPTSVMMFNPIKERFIKKMEEYLRLESANLDELTVEELCD
ncbi:hypothetical protein QR680_016958 [Steinernema hermaphroditum]|uniref:OTU domain-containing protein n=1 Tax=Steinernema hermaphroditum TaxID=289476 RepID=A0AA39LNA2_9BILA|nr:hypothetical protein QR680_016958 [Steinernema hermaphroditum]